MNTLHGGKRDGDGSLELNAQVGGAEIDGSMLDDYRDRYDYLEIQNRDVPGVNDGEGYDVLDSWSEELE